MSEPVFLGLDLGISTVKVALFNGQGELLALESDEYMIMPEGDRAEADPEIYWAPIAASIRRLLKKWGGLPEQIAAVSISSHGETIFPMRADGRPARKALVWMDTRSQPEAEELIAAMGSQKVLEISGQPEVNSVWPVTKFRWMDKYEQNVLQQTACFLLPEDYLVYRLSGRFVGEHTLWSSSLVFDIRTKQASDELLAFSGISPSQLPEFFPAGTAVGHVSPTCAEETGLSTSTVVVTGALDQVCSALAVGNISPGIVTESTGSVLALTATISQPVFDAVTKMPCHIHAIPDHYCLLPWNPTGGLTMKWFKDRFAEDLIARASENGEDVYDLLTAGVEQVPPGCEGLVMLPHLEGAFFPEFDIQARAVFFGFTLRHSRAHFTRAIMEAVAFMIRRDLEGLINLGVAPSEIRVLGGGAKSPLWSQIKADVCRLPVAMPSHREAAVLGAAMLAAVGTGYFPDIPAAVEAMSRPGKRISPNPADAPIYEAAYNLYVSLYETVKPLFPRSKALQDMRG